MAAAVVKGVSGAVLTRGLIKQASLLSKFEGALVGAVAGDALGAHYEVQELITVEEVVKYFEQCRAQKESPQLHKFTDDTAMARSVANSLIHHQGLDVQDMAKRFTEEFKCESWRGYGANVGKVFNQLLKEKYEDPFGPASRQFNGQGSYGNGGGMRVVPAALFGYSYQEEELNELVEKITRITHSHRDAIIGAQLQCAAVQLALHPENSHSVDSGEFLDQLHDWVTKLEEDSNDIESPKPKRRAKRKSELEPRPYCYKLKKMQEFLKQEDTPRSEVVDVLGNDISALGSVPAAIYSFARCTKPIPDMETDNPLERTIMYAVSLGGDTDTIATMAGAIAGAYYGLEKVPEKWKSNCEGVTDALIQAKSLHGLVTKSTSNRISNPDLQ